MFKDEMTNFNKRFDGSRFKWRLEGMMNTGQMAYCIMTVCNTFVVTLGQDFSKLDWPDPK